MTYFKNGSVNTMRVEELEAKYLTRFFFLMFRSSQCVAASDVKTMTKNTHTFSELVV